MELLPVPWTCSFCPRRPPGSAHLGQPPRKKTFLARVELRAQVVDAAAERPTTPGAAIPFHTVTVHDRQRGVVHQFQVPEDQYILHTAEAQNISLPFACRHGCCTSCAVRVKYGQIRQPEALGISPELKSQGRETKARGRETFIELLSQPSLHFDWSNGDWSETTGVGLREYTECEKGLYHCSDLGYALLCVGFPSSDLEVETQDEDEVYWLQFGRYFARGPVDRDDYALELAMADE